MLRPASSERAHSTLPTARTSAGLLQYIPRRQKGDPPGSDGDRRPVSVLGQEPDSGPVPTLSAAGRNSGHAWPGTCPHTRAPPWPRTPGLALRIPPAPEPNRSWSVPARSAGCSPSENEIPANWNPSSASGSRCSRSRHIPAPTLWLRSPMTRCSSRSGFFRQKRIQLFPTAHLGRWPWRRCHNKA